MKRYLLAFLYIITLFGTPLTLVTAQAQQPVIGEYTVLAPLPGTTKDNCTTTNCKADINSYLSGFLGLVIGIGAVTAMIFLGFYGFQYALSDSASVKMANKDKLFEILQGLLLIISAYAIIYTINPALLTFSLEITAPRITAPAVTTTGSGVSANAIIAGYNIGPYATAPNHEAVVTSVYSRLMTTVGSVPTAESISAVINRYQSRSPSPITGAMVLQASQRYNVDPLLIMALMQVDSGYGTAGTAVGTRNPGNVGNMDDGRTRTYSSWQDGVNAVADWLNRHRTR